MGPFPEAPKLLGSERASRRFSGDKASALLWGNFKLGPGLTEFLRVLSVFATPLLRGKAYRLLTIQHDIKSYRYRPSGA